MALKYEQVSSPVHGWLKKSRIFHIKQQNKTRHTA